MTDNNHPITPSPELVHQWAAEHWGSTRTVISSGEEYIAIQAAQWGADMQLEACCEWLSHESPFSERLRAACRPKPPSLAEEAQKALAHLLRHSSTELGSETIRRALERLQELEGQGDD